jgi:hypothetical protein
MKSSGRKKKKREEQLCAWARSPPTRPILLTPARPVSPCSAPAPRCYRQRLGSLARQRVWVGHWLVGPLGQLQTPAIFHSSDDMWVPAVGFSTNLAKSSLPQQTARIRAC